MDKGKYPFRKNILITDDLNLSFGTIRIKPKEVMAYNGLKKILT
jgi:peptidyl-tRNA hydrolase